MSKRRRRKLPPNAQEVEVRDPRRIYLRRSEAGSWTPCRGFEDSSGVKWACYVANWIEENLKIATKSGRIVNLRFNDTQSILLNYVAHCYRLEVPCKCLIPKFRQGGVSTFWEAWFFALVVLKDVTGHAFRATLIAHRDRSSTAIFGIARRFEKHLPAKWKRALEARQQGLIELEATGSMIQVESAQAGDALEKGVTRNAVHLSEVASFADRGKGLTADDAFESTMQALDTEKSWEVFAVLESTAKGRDPFFWVKIQESLRGKIGFQTIFLPWFLHDGYQLSWEEYRRQEMSQGRDCPEEFEPDEDEILLRDQLQAVFVKPGEEWHRYQAVLTDEQLIWRRRCIADKCSGKVHVFQRYYPSFLEECFASQENCGFDGTTIDHYASVAEEPRRVSLSLGHGRPVAVDDQHGCTLIWEEPIPGEFYVLGADVSEGLRGQDAQAAYVLHKRTKRVVAGFYGRVDVDHYAKHLSSLGRYYENAYLAVESNFNPSVAVQLRNSGYPRLYWYRHLTRRPGRTSTKPGWDTNKATRPLMMRAVFSMTRDREVDIRDANFAAEMQNVVWIPSKRHYAAPPGRGDDRVMALSIALVVAGLRGRTHGGPRTKNEDEPEQLSTYELWQREQAWLKRQAKKHEPQGAIIL